VTDVLAKAECEIQVRFVISDVVEKDFGWVFLFDAESSVESGSSNTGLAGNLPLIFDKSDGLVYTSEIAASLDAYIEQYRRGVRTRE
ncbi:MAG: YrhB domain-containing protein, partial [Arenimonas sp.]